MLNFLICLIISFFLTLGISIVLVEKGKDFPIRRYRILLQLLLRKIHWKAPQMLFCTVCTSFWISLFCDIVICCLGLLFGTFYFFWPFSGFIFAGIIWIINEKLNLKQDINVFISKGDIHEI